VIADIEGSARNRNEPAHAKLLVFISPWRIQINAFWNAGAVTASPAVPYVHFLFRRFTLTRQFNTVASACILTYRAFDPWQSIPGIAGGVPG